jgi:hypothetical protein
VAEPREAGPPAPDGGAGAPSRDLEAELKRLTTLQRRARGGDAGALAALRKVLDGDPGWWQRTGDVAYQAEQSWLKAYAGTDELAKEVIARKMKALRRELRGDGGSPLERLLVDRIVLNWLTLYHAESMYAQRLRQPEGVSLESSTHHQERIDRCQKRYLAAIRALAQLRRVAVTVARVLEPDGRHVEAARVEA